MNANFRGRFLAILLMLALVLGARQTIAGPVPGKHLGGTNQPPSPALKTISPGVYDFGKIRVDKNDRSIRFPARVNMNDERIEYLLVAKTGKTHESLLSTEVEPYHIHVAMLLLGATGAEKKPFPEDPQKPLPGDKVKLELRWKADGNEKSSSGEEWILDLAANKAMSAGDWAYTGSNLEQGVFWAQLDGSIIANIEDRDALINNPRPGRVHDDNWKPKAGTVPAVGTAVDVVIRLGK